MSLKLTLERIRCVPRILGTSWSTVKTGGQCALWGDPNIKTLRLCCGGPEPSRLSRKITLMHVAHGEQCLLRVQHPLPNIVIIDLPATQGFGNSLKMTPQHNKDFLPFLSHPSSWWDNTEVSELRRKEREGKEQWAMVSRAESNAGLGEPQSMTYAIDWNFKPS